MRRSGQSSVSTQAVAAPSEQLVEHDRKDHESFMKDRAEFLKKDLKHLFDDTGIDQSQYNDKVQFRDPITKYDSVKGYMFNIGLLRKVFAPNFQMHDLKRTGEYELTSRWTMIMQFTLNRYSPLQRWWDPQLIFTGVSIMGINPENGKFDRHIDLWDALQNNEYLSWEGVKHVASQMGSLIRTPDLPGPPYTILRKTKQYEIRRYEPFLVAEASFGEGSSLGTEARRDPTAKGTEAFRELAGFLFGKNSKQEKMSMTVPVLTDTTGAMQFVLPADMKDRQSVPDPESSNVRCTRNEGGLYAVSIFSGRAESAVCQEKVSKLRSAVQGDAVKVASDDWMLARYNDPSTKPIFRRNEVLVKVKDFDLWAAGCFKG